MKRLKNKKHLLLALLGSFLEYFDYALYGFLGYMIGAHFFPESDPITSMIRTYGIFAVSHFAKPFGALFFGWIGDRFGRAVSLRYTLLGIGIPTFLMGILPGYEDWGMLSIILLILFRFIQGFFIVGEYDGAALYLIEHFGVKRAVFANSLLSTSAMIGIAMASFTVIEFRSFEPYFSDYLWRAPFIIGGLFGLILLYFRSGLIETPFFKNLSKRHHSSFSLRFFLPLWQPLLLVILMFGMVGGLYHFTFIFMEKFLAIELNILLSKTHFYALLLYSITTPFAGLLGDKIGAFKLFVAGFFLTFTHWIFLYFYFDITFYRLWVFGVAISLAFLAAPAYALLLERMPREGRYRILSFGHALGSMLLSGTAPMFGFILSRTTGDIAGAFLYPLVLLLGFALIFLSATLSFPLIRIKESFAKAD